LNHLIIKIRRKLTINYLDIKRIVFKYWLIASGCISQYVFFFSKNDFILKVGPLDNWYTRIFRFIMRTEVERNYFPPPGYGIPPKFLNSQNPYVEYGLFLWPGKLTREFFYFILLVNSIALLPYLSPWLRNYSIGYSIGLVILVSLIVSLLFRAVFMLIPPVLSQVWQKWPESQYDKFLTVPHKVNLKYSDKNRKHEGIYWRPDKATPMRHQSSTYASGMNTLQEVMLHLAIFDFFFSKKEVSDEENSYQSIRIKNWIIYLLSPVWISYGLLLSSFFIYQFCVY